MYVMSELKEKKLLTRKETAFYIGVCEATLQSIIHQKDFPALVRLGPGKGRVFVNREMLDQWLDEQTGK